MLETALKEQVSETGTGVFNSLYSEQELNKDSQVSVRMEQGLYQALEAQTRVWNFKNVSQTVRTILTFYFLPVIYETHLKIKSVSEFKKFLLEKQGEGYSLEQAKANYYLFQVIEYIEFLEQAKVMSTHSLNFMEKTTERMNEIMKEVEEKFILAISEIKQEEGQEQEQVL